MTNYKIFHFKIKSKIKDEKTHIYVKKNYYPFLGRNNGVHIQISISNIVKIYTIYKLRCHYIKFRVTLSTRLQKILVALSEDSSDIFQVFILPTRTGRKKDPSEDIKN